MCHLRYHNSLQILFFQFSSWIVFPTGFSRLDAICCELFSLSLGQLILKKKRTSNLLVTVICYSSDVTLFAIAHHPLIISRIVFSNAVYMQMTLKSIWKLYLMQIAAVCGHVGVLRWFMEQWIVLVQFRCPFWPLNAYIGTGSGYLRECLFYPSDQVKQKRYALGPTC